MNKEILALVIMSVALSLAIMVFCFGYSSLALRIVDVEGKVYQAVSPLEDELRGQTNSLLKEIYEDKIKIGLLDDNIKILSDRMDKHYHQGLKRGVRFGF